VPGECVLGVCACQVCVSGSATHLHTPTTLLDPPQTPDMPIWPILRAKMGLFEPWNKGSGRW